MVWKGSNIEAGQEHLAGFICCSLLCLLCYFGSFLLDPRQWIALGLGFFKPASSKLPKLRIVES